MPKYEYACKSCAQHVEVVQSFADAPLVECPACGGQLRKVFSAPGISFKGSGFYRTDNRKRRTEPKVDANGESKGEAKTDAKSDAKSDAKGETKGETKSEPAKKETSSAGESKPKAAEAKTA